MSKPECKVVRIGTVEPSRKRCLRCGFTTKPTHSTPEQIHSVCKNPEGAPIYGPELGIPELAFNFGKAAVKDALNLFKRRSLERIREIHTICSGGEDSTRACPWFYNGRCRHEKCGCNVNAQKKYFNKLAMESEICPDNPPRWT